MAARPVVPSVEFVIKAREDLSLEGVCRTIPRVKQGDLYPCQMQKTQQFSCLFRHYAKHNGLKKEDLIFFFVDELNPDETPEDVHLLLHDEIIVGLRRSGVEQNITGNKSGFGAVDGTEENGAAFAALSNDLKSMLFNRKLADVAFEYTPEASAHPSTPNREGSTAAASAAVVSGSKPERVYGHKAILAARSTYFNAMFVANSFSESRTSGSRSSSGSNCDDDEADDHITVIRTYHRPAVFRMVMEYLYTGKVDFLQSFVSSYRTTTNTVPPVTVGAGSPLLGAADSRRSSSGSSALGNDVAAATVTSAVAPARTVAVPQLTSIISTSSLKRPSTAVDIESNNGSICGGDDEEEEEPNEWTDSVCLILDLIACANELLFTDLQLACENAFVAAAASSSRFANRSNMQLVTMSNICQFTHICDTCQAHVLRQVCQDFILQHIDEIRGDEQLRREIAQTPDLALLLVDAISASKSTSGSYGAGQSTAKRLKLNNSHGNRRRAQDNDSASSANNAGSSTLNGAHSSP